MSVTYKKKRHNLLKSYFDNFGVIFRLIIQMTLVDLSKSELGLIRVFFVNKNNLRPRFY